MNYWQTNLDIFSKNISSWIINEWRSFIFYFKQFFCFFFLIDYTVYTILNSSHWKIWVLLEYSYFVWFYFFSEGCRWKSEPYKISIVLNQPIYYNKQQQYSIFFESCLVIQSFTDFWSFFYTYEYPTPDEIVSKLTIFVLKSLSSIPTL